MVVATIMVMSAQLINHTWASTCTQQLRPSFIIIVAMLMLVVQLICGVIKMVPSVTLVHLYYEHNVIVIANPTLHGLCNLWTL